MDYAPISYAELTKDPADLIEPDEKAMAEAKPEGCPFNGGGRTAKGVTHYLCKLMASQIGQSNAAHEDCCRACICNGAPDPMANPYIRRNILAWAWTLTITQEDALRAGEEASDLAGDIKARCDIAVANVKRLAGEAIAKRFVDSLVFNETVPPEDAADLLAAHDLLGVKR